MIGAWIWYGTGTREGERSWEDAEAWEGAGAWEWEGNSTGHGVEPGMR